MYLFNIWFKKIKGANCEISIFCQKKVRPCGDSHQCIAVNQSYECHCDKPYIGHGCDKSILFNIIFTCQNDFIIDENVAIKKK